MSPGAQRIGDGLEENLGLARAGNAIDEAHRKSIRPALPDDLERRLLLGVEHRSRRVGIGRQHDRRRWHLQPLDRAGPLQPLDHRRRGAARPDQRRLEPSLTIGEAIENIPGKFFKEADVWVKTKTPVLVLKTDNEIPKE